MRGRGHSGRELNRENEEKKGGEGVE